MPAPRPHQHTYTPPPAPPPPPNTQTHLPPDPWEKTVSGDACMQSPTAATARCGNSAVWQPPISFCSALAPAAQPDARVCRAVGATSLRHGAAGRQPMTWDVWCQTADDVRCSLVVCLVSDSRWREVFTRYVSAVRQPMTWGVHPLCVWCQTADDVRCSLVMCLVSESRWREVFTRYVSAVRQPMTWGVHSLCLLSGAVKTTDDVRCSLVSAVRQPMTWGVHSLCLLSGVRQPMTWGVHSLCLLSGVRQPMTWGFHSAVWYQTAYHVRCSLVMCPMPGLTADDVRCSLVMCPLSCVRQSMTCSLCVCWLVSDRWWREVFTRYVSTVWCQTADDVRCSLVMCLLSSVRQPMTWGVWCQTADDVRCSLVRCLVLFATRLPSAPREAAPRRPVTWERRVQKVGSRVLDPRHALQQWNVTPVRGARLKWAYVYTVYVYGTLDTERC